MLRLIFGASWAGDGTFVLFAVLFVLALIAGRKIKFDPVLR